MELQSRDVLSYPYGLSKVQQRLLTNAGKAAFVAKILLTNLHELRACRTITQKGSGGILCEAMAEVVGVLASGFTLAGLFKVCLDAIDLIQTAQHQELDLKKLLLKLNIEKCRLYTWGEEMGLTAAPVVGKPRPLDSCPDHVQDLVKDTLDMIIQLFTDSKEAQRSIRLQRDPTTDGVPPAPYSYKRLWPYRESCGFLLPLQSPH